MTTLTVSTLEEKLHDLCEAIVADEEVAAARLHAEAFLADTDAVALYRRLMQSQNELHHKQHSGEKISDPEIHAFSQLRDQAEANPLIQNFNEAQETLQGIANLVNGFVTKTLEKGRIPTEEEVIGSSSSGGCGSGCGCH
ncbi:MAG: YlbF family regulator [Verrucomicrobiales bacterium]